MSQSQKGLLALDWGLRKVGIATADCKGISTTTHPIYFRDKAIKEDDLWSLSESEIQWLKNWIEEWDCGTLILGQPLSMDGNENNSSKGAKELAQRMKSALGIPVVLVNESLTSWEIKTERKTQKRSGKNKIDKIEDSLVAARLIEIYLRQK
jgi:putative Holliday junction resolvase